ncbi:MAG: hypothetical protein J5685_00580 [Clostridiales bacterium]|nr:hypothetical protein [Clostridiales bacterium]
MYKSFRRSFLTVSVLQLLSVAFLAGCTLVSPIDTSDPSSVVDPTADTRIFVDAPEESSTPAPTEVPTPSPIPVMSYLYDDFHVASEWHDYMVERFSGDDLSGALQTNNYTRLSDDYIGTFVPSDDYGYVFPFLAIGDREDNIIPTYNVSVRCKYGLADVHGRIVCDGVFSNITDYSDKAYYITESYDGDTVKYGILSKDGSYYSGQIYDKYELFCDRMTGSEYVIFRRLTEDGLTVTAYSDECWIYISERPFLFYPSGPSIEIDGYDPLYSYISIDYIDPDGTAFIRDGSSSTRKLIDYTTGQDYGIDLEGISGAFYTGIGFIVFESDDPNYLGTCGYINWFGDRILTGYKGFDITATGLILFYDTDNYESVLIDIYGNTVYEFDGVARYVAGYYYLYTDDGSEEADILDDYFEVIGSSDVDIRSCAHISSGSNSIFGDYSSVIFWYREGDEVFAVNALTGDRVSMSADNVTVNTVGDNSFSLHASGQYRLYGLDMEEIVPGSNNYLSETDHITGNTYVFNDTVTFTNADTGEQFFDFYPDLGSAINRVEICDGYVMVMSNEKTVIFDSIGNINFVFNAIHVLDD